MKENDKLREHILGLNESLRHLKEINDSFKIDITKIRNPREERKRRDSLIKEVNETLGKFIQRKEKLDLILSSQRFSINNNELGFKKDRKPMKCINHKKK